MLAGRTSSDPLLYSLVAAAGTIPNISQIARLFEAPRHHDAIRRRTMEMSKIDRLAIP